MPLSNSSLNLVKSLDGSPVNQGSLKNTALKLLLVKRQLISAPFSFSRPSMNSSMTFFTARRLVGAFEKAVLSRKNG